MSDSLPLPPADLRFMGEDEEAFLAVGDELVRDLTDLCGLKVESSVLDVGSGYGRVAHALWRHGWRGDYLGLDILSRHVRWCQEMLTPSTNGHLRFRHMDVRNARYNPQGTVDTASVSFDHEADVVVLASVFTHMYPNEVRHYLAEIGRSLVGRAFVTFFCLDEDWEVALRHEVEPGCRYQTPEDPLHRIGYTPRWIHEEVDRAGLRVYATSPGRWNGRPAGRGHQDAFVLETSL